MITLDSFRTDLQGPVAHKKAELVNGDLNWNNGDIWERLWGPFDGWWTDMKEPGLDIFKIKNNTIGGGNASMTLIPDEGGRSFCTKFKPKPGAAAEEGACGHLVEKGCIQWTTGALWCPAQSGEFDGLWTGKANPGSQYFVIEGEMLFFDANLESRIQPRPNFSFDTELVGAGKNTHAQLVQTFLPTGPELQWTNGDIWILNTTPPLPTTTTTTRTTTGAPTTTGRLACWEPGTYWATQDMDGSSYTLVKDEFECQDRCIAQQGCMHFSLETLYLGAEPEHHCHVQDATSLKVGRTGSDEKAGWTSGPKNCNLLKKKHKD